MLLYFNFIIVKHQEQDRMINRLRTYKYARSFKNYYYYFYYTFLILKWYFPHYFRALSAPFPHIFAISAIFTYFHDFRNLDIDFRNFKIEQSHLKFSITNFKVSEIDEICGNPGKICLRLTHLILMMNLFVYHLIL